MKEGIIRPTSRIVRKPDQEGKSIEEHLRLMIAGKEPIDLGAKIQYTERKDGVHAEYDIRTDRFMIAMGAWDKAHATNYAQRMQADGFVKDENGKWIPKPDTPQA